MQISSVVQRRSGKRAPRGGVRSAKLKKVQGQTWGGCLESIDGLAFVNRLPDIDALRGSILILGAVAGVVMARPPVSDFEFQPPREEADALRAAQRDAVIDVVTRYNSDAVICVGPPFGHTRPQWIVPYGGTMTLDGHTRTIMADYS